MHTKTRTRRSLRPSAKVRKQMQPFSLSNFDTLLERAIKPPARKLSAKSR